MGWFDDCYRLDLQSFHWRKLHPKSYEPPKPPEETAAPAGGGGGGVWGKLARKSAAAATAPKAPSARAAHASCVLGGDAMLLFGGRAATGRLNDTWLLEGIEAATASEARLQWRLPELAGAPPRARSFHSMTTLPGTRGKMAALFGGLDADGHHLNDVHVFSGGAGGEWAWARVRQAAGTAPCARASAFLGGLAPKTNGAGTLQLLVFGGSSQPGEMGDSVFHDDTYAADLTAVVRAIGRATRSGADEATEAVVDTEEQQAEAAADEQPTKKARIEAAEAVAGGAPPSVPEATAAP